MASGAIASGRRLRASRARVHQCSAVEDIRELRPDRETEAFRDVELASNAEVLHGPPLLPEGGQVPRATEAARSRIGPRRRIQNNRGVGVEAVAVNVYIVERLPCRDLILARRAHESEVR